MSAEENDCWDTAAGQRVLETFSSNRFQLLLKTTLAASGASLALSNFNPSTGLTNSLVARSARTALCLQAHYEPQHKGCRPAEGKEPALIQQVAPAVLLGMLLFAPVCCCRHTTNGVCELTGHPGSFGNVTDTASISGRGVPISSRR